jgi:hypothetical protein
LTQSTEYIRIMLYSYIYSQMTKSQAEQIYALMASPYWQTYISYKQDKLNKLHKDLEWEDANVKKIQGQIAEIRSDLNLIKTVNQFLLND